MSISVILFFSTFFMFLYLLVGIMIGWTVNEFAYNYLVKSNSIQFHPEMYDEDGIWINEELLAVKFVDEDEIEEEEETD